MPQKSSKNNNNGVITAKKWDHGWNYDIINLTPPLLIILSLRFKALCFHPRSNDISVSRWLVWCLSCSTDCTSVSQTTDRRPTMFLFSFPLVPPRLSFHFLISSCWLVSPLLSPLLLFALFNSHFLSSCLFSSVPLVCSPLVTFPHLLCSSPLLLFPLISHLSLDSSPPVSSILLLLPFFVSLSPYSYCFLSSVV